MSEAVQDDTVAEQVVESEAAEAVETDAAEAKSVADEVGVDEAGEQYDEDSSHESDSEDSDSEDSEDEDSEDEDSGIDGASEGSSKVARLENEGDIAADYLEELLDIADLDGDLDMDVVRDRAMVSIVGAELQQLIGRNGEVLEALQELTRLAVYRETGERSRLMLDISGHRASVRARLEDEAREAIAKVKETGEKVSLKPMGSFERKVVHDVVTASGLVSESEGMDPRRFVVILPA